mmetsp:Transcript_4393/g.7475  ORF Transcript_4393/g.7475 Transcript_4393/m.7475 type:complete len:348 (+) Transcript_4393:242-1285(+)
MAENASAVVSSVRLRPAVLSRIYSKRVSFFRFVVLFLCCGFTFRVGYLFGVNDSGSLAPRTNSPEAIAQPETVTYDNETSAVSTVDLHEQPAIPTVLVVSTQRPTHAPSPPPPCKCSVALTAEGGGIVYFVEVLAALGDGLKELGVDVISTTIPECLQPGSPSDKSCSGRKIITVMFCPYASRKDKPRLPSDTIVYHLEPPTPDHWCSVDDVFNPMKEYAVVWTYTDHFAKILGSKLGGKSVSYLPLGYVPSLELKVDPLPVETCDVAFYGAGNDHRNGILQHLTARGVKVCWQNGWGAERDNVMLTSKIMLNIHFYQKNFGKRTLHTNGPPSAHSLSLRDRFAMHA